MKWIVILFCAAMFLGCGTENGGNEVSSEAPKEKTRQQEKYTGNLLCIVPEKGTAEFKMTQESDYFLKGLVNYDSLQLAYSVNTVIYPLNDSAVIEEMQDVVTIGYYHIKEYELPDGTKRLKGHWVSKDNTKRIDNLEFENVK
ncbi:MAG: hypothetical protein AAF502_15755 [Bacteroidota bacterium]